jgi:hypothetical protein
MRNGLLRATAYSAWAVASVAAADRWFWQSEPTALMLFTLGAFVGELTFAARLNCPACGSSRPWRLAFYLACVAGLALSGLALLRDSVAVHAQCSRP